jgi:hypothetical protein
MFDRGFTMNGISTSVTITLVSPADSLNSAITVISFGHLPRTGTNGNNGRDQFQAISPANRQ